jgi:hypothetical protein
MSTIITLSELYEGFNRGGIEDVDDEQGFIDWLKEHGILVVPDQPEDDKTSNRR